MIDTRALGVGDGGEEGDEAGAAEEFSDEKGGVGLSLRGVDALQALPQNAVFVAAFTEYSTPVATHNSFTNLHSLLY